MLMEAFVLTALDTLWWPQSRGGPLGLGSRPMSLPADDPLLGNHQLLKNKYPNNSSSREQMYSRRNVSASLGLLLFFRLNIYMSSKKQRDCIFTGFVNYVIPLIIGRHSKPFSCQCKFMSREYIVSYSS